MSISDLIKSAVEGDATAFESKFEEIMNAKQEAAIAVKYDSMFEAKDEEDEDEDEMDDEDEMEDDEEDDDDEDEEDED